MTGHETREIYIYIKAELVKKLAYIIREFEIYPERTEDPIRRFKNRAASFHSFTQQIHIY